MVGVHVGKGIGDCSSLPACPLASLDVEEENKERGCWKMKIQTDRESNPSISKKI